MGNVTVKSRDVDGAREEILNYIRRSRDEKIIYFYGWSGFGAAPVLRSMVQLLRSIKAKETPPPELCYDIIIYVDCSSWISKRVMQRKIAEELELDPETMALFDKQDEEDDFNQIDHGSRGVIRSVSEVLARTLWYKKVMTVFLNGSDDEVDLNKFGISPDSCDHVVIWTFKRRLLHDKLIQNGIENKTRNTHRFIKTDARIMELSTSEFGALLREEAATLIARNPLMHDIDTSVLLNCCLYYIFLHYCFRGSARLHWACQAPNCWLSDGNREGEIARQISNALQQEINWECNAPLLEDVFEKLIIKDPGSPFLIVKDDTVYQNKPYSWIWISTSPMNQKVWEDMETILAAASSFFVAFENSKGQKRLPNRLFQQCSNLHVLILSWCTFSFVSPPFLQCNQLRFLGLEHCTDNTALKGFLCKLVMKQTKSTDWAFLHKLQVLDIRYTHWDEIVTEEKMNYMTNLQELNIEGFCCWKYISKLQGRMPNLQRLRIIKPMKYAETMVDSSNSFMDKTKLEILDLSGNKDMKNLPASLSKAISLQLLILDGCDGLENVVLSNGLPSSLRLFSFDGYGPASHWTSTLELPHESSRPKCASNESNKGMVKTSKISLQGCKKLENIFVRGLPNLVELDLSGSAIKKIDFNNMVVDVPILGRLFLLGCQHLRAISLCKSLDLICMDTRPGTAPGFNCLSHAQQEPSAIQLHAILVDARLIRSIIRPLESSSDKDHYFNIHITSSIEYDGAVLFEAAHEVPIEFEPSNLYGDVFRTIGYDPLMVFPQPPATPPLDRRIEISGASPSLESELRVDEVLSVLKLAGMMLFGAESLHVHDALTSASMPDGDWLNLRFCRMERCPNMSTIFPPGATESNNRLEIIWASELHMVRSIWSKGSRERISFQNLKHLHLRSCPRLQFVLPIWVSSFPSLKSIHIIHCSDLRHIFVLDGRYPEEIVVHGVPFPKLSTIHLYDLPKLRQICEVKVLAPALETIKIRGCFSLGRLPAVDDSSSGVQKPAVEIEKDVWDALEWDGLAAGHHPDLYQVPVHSRYYRRRGVPRRTVLSSASRIA